MNYYNEIKDKLINNEIYGRVKDYSKERNRLETYFEVGKLLSEAGKHYGEGIIKDYSNKLTCELGKKYESSSLNKMKKFYLLIQKMATLSPKLSYGHYVELLPIKDYDKINYYIKVIEKQNLSIRELRKKIKLKEYERLPKESIEKLISNEQLKLEEIIPNPIIIKNINNYEITSEKALQMLILEDIESFMRELGNSFSFIGSEYKVKIGESYNYIDLLLFNIEYNCYVVVELKVVELKKEHIGQIEVYMNYIDKNVKKIFHDKTIGIIICKRDNKFIIEYSSDERIVSRYYEIR